MNWHQLQHNNPQQVTLFYNWLENSIQSKRLVILDEFKFFFHLPDWAQISIVFEYLKDSKVEVIEINPLDENDCVQFIIEYFNQEAQKSKGGADPMDIQQGIAL